MTVLARDAVASDHLVYAWPFPIGPECEVACAEDEQVVMCPAWMVGDRLGPGRHRWRTPDPSRPVGAFFVLTAPVEVSFDMVTSFVIPTTGMPVRLRASGSLQVRCSDPGLLIAQFVGLPFDHVNDGVLRSVARSVERMLARLLTRRAVMAGTPLAVTDASMLQGIVEELIAYHPTAGAVFGVELVRIGYLVVVADDGSTPYLALPASNPSWHPNGNGHHHGHRNAHTPTTPPPIVQQELAQPAPSGPQYPRPATPVLETLRGMPAVSADDEPPAQVSGEIVPRHTTTPPTQVSGEIVPRHTTTPPSAVSGEIVPRQAPMAAAPSVEVVPPSGPPVAVVSGEIVARHSVPPVAPPPVEPPPGPPVAVVSGEIAPPRTKSTLPPPLPPLARKSAPQIEPPAAAAPPAEDDAPRPDTPAPRATTTAPMPKLAPLPKVPVATPAPAPAESRGSISGIGIGGGVVGGEIAQKIAPGQRVLVPGPNGLMQSATVRQLLQGYYELEVGSSGETIWVPIGGVVPEQI